MLTKNKGILWRNVLLRRCLTMRKYVPVKKLGENFENTMKGLRFFFDQTLQRIVVILVCRVYTLSIYISN